MRPTLLIGLLLAAAPSVWAARRADARPAESASPPAFALVSTRALSSPLGALLRGETTSRFALVGGHATPRTSFVNPHGNISLACETCHTPERWTPLRADLAFDHDTQTPFVLTGRHEMAACTSCHLDLRFDGPDVTADACASCHLDVHRGQLGAGCADCHNTTDFGLARSVELHARTGFPLTGAHLQTSCESCHADAADGVFAPLDPACMACHADDYAATTNSLVDHVAAGFPTDCATCHGTLAFASGAGFDHTSVSRGFSLLGAHGTLPCSSCHAVPSFDGLWQPSSQEDCFACHAEDYEATATTSLVDHPAAGLPTDCRTCHGLDQWEGATADHAVLSGGFQLVGAHLALDCATCHRGPDFSVPENPASQDDCLSCHADDHQEAHPAFPTTCTQCHGTDSFAGASFDHASVTGYPLVGAHATAECASCHALPGFEPLFQPAGPDDCLTCHAPDHQAAHASFPTTCATCHTQTAFDPPVAVDHAAVSGGFNLVGAHLTLDCATCHRNPDFSVPEDPASQDDCFSCHADDHQAAHPAFPTTCQTCHSTTSFDGASFDHAGATGYPLIGAHAVTECQSCHTLPDFEPIWQPAGPDDCFTCHAPDHQTAHASFPTTCATCHTQTAFDPPVAVDHAAVSGGFQLVGAHLAIECASCHRNPDFSVPEDPASQDDCVSCHADDHQAAHPNFPTTCATCHNTNTFEGATFDHQAVTGYPLVAAHGLLACQSCHTGPDFEPIWQPAGPNDCQTCHADDHQVAHPTFPTTCETCHNQTAFTPVTIDHGAVSGGFNLVGAHVAAPCQSCHSGPNFEVPTNPANQDDCFACHASEHQAAHPSFPTTCATCHNTSTFEGATFDHQQTTGFPLLGAHLALPCSSCHTGPDFEPIWNPSSAEDCYTCHVDEYQAQHAGSGFPTTCLSCHNTNTWQGAQFDHDPFFPIYSGRHQGEWNSCQDCHTQPGNYQVFSCITCHEHNREDMDDEHEDVGGYSYNSNACFSCHPDGED